MTKRDENTAAAAVATVRQDAAVPDEKIVPFQYAAQKPAVESISQITLLNTSADQWKATKLFLRRLRESGRG
uniref:RanBD1 domain-containing protein n=1 Tax=Steinernema glaseri TaxID=37863 RepID=A0A1I8A644_9BILA